MTFTSPLGLLALLAVPAVIALHLFRRKFKERRVGGLFLFAPDHLRSTSGRKRTRLLRSASLLCEIAAAILAALWLGGLAFGVTADSVHVVIVLDDSASMAAEREGASAADRARAQIRTKVEALPEGAFATVILTGSRPEILIGPRELASTVPAALESWRPWRPSHDAADALDLGSELAGERGELWFFTDHYEPEIVPRTYSLYGVGRYGDNVSLLSARRHRTAEDERVFVDVCSYARQARETSLTVLAIGVDGVKTLAERKLDLDPDEPQHVALKMPVTDAPVVVQLGKDALDLDNQFTLLPQPARVVGVAIATDEETAASLEVARVVASLDDVRIVDDIERAHLVIGEDPTSRRHEIRIGAISEERDVWIGPYLIERRDPLCDGLTLDGVVWNSGKGEQRGFPLVSAGSQALVTRDESTIRLRLRVNLDPLRSNFSTSPDWPILLSNVCEAVRETLPGTPEPNGLVGSLLRWRRMPGPERALRLVDPFGTEWPGRGLQLVTWRARHPGEHQLMDGDQEVARFSVNFADAYESDLRKLRSGERPADEVEVRDEAEMSTGTGRTERRWLALALLLAIGLDWFFLRRGGSGA